MATWTVRTASGVRAGLTVYQVDQLVRRGVIGPEDPASPDDAIGPEWHAVEDIPKVEQERRARAAAQPPPRLDDRAVAAMLAASADDDYARGLRRASVVLWLGAGALVAVEAAVLISALVSS